MVGRRVAPPPANSEPDMRFSPHTQRSSSENRLLSRVPFDCTPQENTGTLQGRLCPMDFIVAVTVKQNQVGGGVVVMVAVPVVDFEQVI